MTDKGVNGTRISALWMGIMMCASLQAGVSVQETAVPGGFPLVRAGQAASLIVDASG